MRKVLLTMIILLTSYATIFAQGIETVSYTHLTLPTILLV